MERRNKSDITKGKNFTQGLNGNRQRTDHDTQFNRVRVVVIGIIRSDYVEGSQECADGIPEEDDLQNKRERGETVLLKLKPQVPTICTEASSSKNDTRFSAKRSKLAETLSTREHFRSISQGQVDAMMIFANAAKTQTEVSMITAVAITEIAKGVKKLNDAVTMQAENEATRIPILGRLVEVLENILPTYLQE